MHIPDSALSPVTSLVGNVVMVPIWWAAARRLRRRLATRQLPLLALGSAFAFAVMMLNVPMPGGTTVHATGGVLLAVLLGPWAAVVGMTVALAIQALFFGDGGVFALGVNAFALAFALPVTGYVAYRLLAGGSPPAAWRRAAAAGAGGYVGTNVAALLTALVLGIQPALWQDASGRALYFPFGLAVTLPALMLAHLTLAGLAEAAVTALAVRHLQRGGVPLHAQPGAPDQASRGERLWLALALVVALAPLGLLAEGGAWGEWSGEELRARLGYVPAGLAAAEARGGRGLELMPDYLSERGPLAYAMAGAAGALLVAATLLALGLLLRRRERPSAGPPGGPPPRVRPGEVPDWLRGAEPEASAPEPPRGAARRDFVERSLLRLTETWHAAHVAEAWARRPGLLQALDARAKIVALLGLVVLTAALHDAAGLGLLLAFAVVLAALSRLPLVAYLARVWLTVPFLALAVTLPAALNLVTPGTALVVLSEDPLVSVTAPGLAVATRLALRVGVALSFVLLLVRTTPAAALLRGARQLGVPALFVALLGMTWRYLAVVLQASAESLLAQRSRVAGRLPVAAGQRVVGGSLAALFARARALAEEVHEALLARGWTGEPAALAPARAGAAELGLLAATAGAGLLTLLLAAR